MSGGSFNYLCWKDSEQLFDYDGIEDLEQMADELLELGYKDAAMETYDLLRIIKQSKVRVQVIQDRLKPVFKAVEWLHSGDSGMESVKDAIDEYREEGN